MTDRLVYGGKYFTRNIESFFYSPFLIYVSLKGVCLILFVFRQTLIMETAENLEGAEINFEQILALRICGVAKMSKFEIRVKTG